jgi:transcriptional regulator with XRE-family HTH domain
MTTTSIEPKIQETQIGSDARKLRISLHITRREVAEAAGVSEHAVNLFEHNLPVALDYKRRILKELWSIKNKK